MKNFRKFLQTLGIKYALGETILAVWSEYGQSPQLQISLQALHGLIFA